MNRPVSTGSAPSLRGGFGVFVRQARNAWRQRTPREQALLRGAVLLIFLAVLWTVGVRPALQTVQRAHQQLPVLQAEAAQLSAVLLEAKALGRGRSGTLSVPATEAALTASLDDAGLDQVSVFSRAEGPASEAGQWQVQFIRAPAGRVIEWVSRLPLVAQVQIREADLARSVVDGRDRPGQLDGRIIVAMPAKVTP